MKKAMRCFTTVLAMLLMLSIVCSGCTSILTDLQTTTAEEISCETTTESVEPIERDTILRVAIPTSTNNITFVDLTDHINQWVRTFETTHRNVDVVIESAMAEERLQTELMAGKGPDVILSPTTTTMQILNHTMEVGSIPISDVNLAMQNGIFYDISAFYDTDEELNKDALEPAVMEAGVLDGKRFVLPLRYNLLVAYVDMDRFEKTGLSTEIFEKDITYFWDALTEYGDPYLASSALIRSQDRSELNLIGELIDYDNQEVLLTQEVLVDYLQSEQNFLITRGENEVSFYALLHEYYVPGMDAAFADNGWMNVMRPKTMFVGGLDFAIHNAVIAESQGIDLGMYPLRSTDCSVTADITFYGAVTRGSENPELAYEFLRYFLTEESPWEENVRFLMKDGIGSCLMLPGWPVRVKGSAGALHTHLKGWTWNIQRRDGKINNLADAVTYTDEDIPILNIKIDKARFPTGLEGTFCTLSGSVYNVFTGEQLYDLKSAAADFIEELEWHVGEG